MTTSQELESKIAHDSKIINRLLIALITILTGCMGWIVFITFKLLRS